MPDTEKTEGGCPIDHTKRETPLGVCPFSHQEIKEAALPALLEASSNGIILRQILDLLVPSLSTGQEKMLLKVTSLSNTDYHKFLMALPEGYQDPEIVKRVLTSDRPGLELFDSIIKYGSYRPSQLNDETVLGNLDIRDETVTRVRQETQDPLAKAIASHMSEYENIRGSANHLKLCNFYSHEPELSQIETSDVSKVFGIKSVSDLCTGLHVIEDLPIKLHILGSKGKDAALAVEELINLKGLLNGSKDSSLTVIGKGFGSASELIFNTLTVLFDHFEKAGYPESVMGETLKEHQAFLWKFTKISLISFVAFNKILLLPEDPTKLGFVYQCMGTPPGHDPRQNLNYTQKYNSQYFTFREKTNSNGDKFPILDLNMDAFTLEDIMDMRTASPSFGCPANQAGVNSRYIPFTLDVFKQAYRGFLKTNSAEASNLGS